MFAMPVAWKTILVNLCRTLSNMSKCIDVAVALVNVQEKPTARYIPCKRERNNDYESEIRYESTICN